jgi:small GTP-binding protein
MAEGKRRPSFKTVLLGDSGVGKTSLLTRWTLGRYIKTTVPTVGATHHRKPLVLDDEEVDLFLWDTAGQEQFQALAPLYARWSSAAILVTSIVDPRSFQNIDKWISLLESANDQVPPVILAINKVDLRSEGARSMDELETEFRGRFAAIFFVSAATGEEVENLFKFAALTGYRFNRTSQQQPRAPIIVTQEQGCC